MNMTSAPAYSFSQKHGNKSNTYLIQMINSRVFLVRVRLFAGPGTYVPN